MCSLSESRIRPIKRIARRRVRLHLAPEGRYVYSTRHTPNILSPRGATCALCLNHGFGGLIKKPRHHPTIEPVGVGCPNPLGGRGNLAPTMDAAPQIVPPFAPEERYVYSSATPPIPALQRSAMWYCRTPLEPVGVGCPNPSGEATSPLRWMPHLAILVHRCLSLQRSDMSIAARHVQPPRSRGAQCGIVAHP